MKAVFSMAAIRRKMLQVLERWNESKAKKAFLLVGARQTGKTYIVREFAREGVRTVTWTAAYAASPNRLLRLSIVS